MQTQRLIPFPPQVSHPRFSLHYQRLDTQILQPRSDLQPSLSATNDDHLRVLVQALDLPLAFLMPFTVIRGLLAKILDLFREVVKTFEVGEDGVSEPGACDG